MTKNLMKVAPDTVVYADEENLKLVAEFAIPGAPADTVDVKILRRQHSPNRTCEGHRVCFLTSLGMAG